MAEVEQLLGQLELGDVPWMLEMMELAGGETANSGEGAADPVAHVKRRAG